MVRFLLVFLPLAALLVFGEHTLFERLGLESHPVLGAAIAALVTLEIFEYKPVFIVAILGLAGAASLSPESALSYGFQADYAVAGFLSAIISPLIMRQFD